MHQTRYTRFCFTTDLIAFCNKQGDHFSRTVNSVLLPTLQLLKACTRYYQCYQHTCAAYSTKNVPDDLRTKKILKTEEGPQQSSRHWCSQKREVTNKQQFSLMLPRLLWTVPWIPWQLFNSLTFSGFPAKWSPSTKPNTAAWPDNRRSMLDSQSAPR